MGSIGAWLAAVVGPLATRVLLALGIGIISTGALSVVLGNVLSAAKSALGGVGADLLNLLQLAGFTGAFAIIAGGMITSVTLTVVKRLGVFTTGS